MTIEFIWQLLTQSDGERSDVTNHPVHVFNALPPRSLKILIDDLQSLALHQRRDVVAGLRIDVLARETEEEAITAARQFLNPAHFDFNSHWQAPEFATPFAQQGSSAHSALVGSYDDVSEQFLQYIDAGVEVFVLAAIPHDEEKQRFEAHVIPRVRAALSQRAPERPAFERAVSAA